MTRFLNFAFYAGARASVGAPKISCGYVNVYKDRAGKYVCAGCEKTMPQDWAATVKTLGLKVPA